MKKGERKEEREGIMTNCAKKNTQNGDWKHQDKFFIFRRIFFVV